MLILKRKIGESVMIGDDIEVVVLEQDGDAVKIGIRAPRSVKVYRKEIHEEICAVNKSALQPPELTEIVKEYQKTMKNNEK